MKNILLKSKKKIHFQLLFNHSHELVHTHCSCFLFFFLPYLTLHLCVFHLKWLIGSSKQWWWYQQLWPVHHEHTTSSDSPWTPASPEALGVTQQRISVESRGQTGFGTGSDLIRWRRAATWQPLCFMPQQHQSNVRPLIALADVHMLALTLISNNDSLQLNLSSSVKLFTIFVEFPEAPCCCYSEIYLLMYDDMIRKKKKKRKRRAVYCHVFRFGAL